MSKKSTLLRIYATLYKIVKLRFSARRVDMVSLPSGTLRFAQSPGEPPKRARNYTFLRLFAFRKLIPV